MQRKFLEELGLEKEVIDKIMSENGSDIENTKKKLEAERDNYRSQLETAQETLKSFDGVDVNDLKGKITQLTNDLNRRCKLHCKRRRHKGSFEVFIFRDAFRRKSQD